MRRALIAGIHANLVALEAVLNDIEQEGVDEIGCLGGILVFGPDVNECIDLVRNRCTWSLAGYHEHLVIGRDTTKLSGLIQLTIDRSRSLLEPDEVRADGIDPVRWNWLCSLTSMRTDADTLFVYGSVRDAASDFILAEDFELADVNQSIKVREIFRFDQAVCFCANTGRPGLVEQGSAWMRPIDLGNSQRQLNQDVKTIVNIGSVGQPRDCDPRSCYVVWDDEERTVTFHRVPYDLEAAKKRFQAVPDLSVRHWDRLVRGV